MALLLSSSRPESALGRLRFSSKAVCLYFSAFPGPTPWVRLEASDPLCAPNLAGFVVAPARRAREEGGSGGTGCCWAWVGSSAPEGAPQPCSWVACCACYARPHCAGGGAPECGGRDEVALHPGAAGGNSSALECTVGAGMVHELPAPAAGDGALGCLEALPILHSPGVVKELLHPGRQGRCSLHKERPQGAGGWAASAGCHVPPCLLS